MYALAVSVLEPYAELALSLPETSSAGSCVNTAYKVGKKNFLFLGEKPSGYVIRLRLKDGLEEAREVAAREPGIQVADMGWVTIKRPLDEPPPAQLSAWIEESYRTLALKKHRAALDAR